MALRTINFEVGKDERLSPNTVQDGGVQGDHNITELKFKLSDDLHKHLQDTCVSGKLIYRFDGFDGEGKKIPSDTFELTESEVVYPLSHKLTKHGGLVKVELIISYIEEVENNDDSVSYKTSEVVHTPPARLKLIFSSYASGQDEEYKDMSTLAEIIKQKRDETYSILEEIKTAKAELETLWGNLQNVNEFIFQGGTASDVLETDFVIDDVMSEYSRNAVQNRVIKQYVDTNIETEVGNQMKENSHPVGSIFITHSDINPKDIGFGGVWVQIDKDLATNSGSLNINEENLESNGIFKYSESTVSGVALNYYCEGHFLSMSFNVIPKKALTESGFETYEIPIGDLTLEKFGIEPFAETAGNRRVYFTGYSDEAKAIAMMYLDLAKGTIFIADIISANGNNSIPENQAITFSFNLSIPGNKTIAAACDKFYWKRTA